VLASRGTAYRLAGALAAVAAVAAALTFFVPGVLTGPAVMNGSARGTALVVLAVAVPVLVASMALAARGSARALVCWLGAAAYLLYNAVMFVFGTPFNELFLLYVAMLSLAVWSLVAVLRRVDLGGLRARFDPALPVRAIAWYVWVIVGLNTLVWLRTIVPALTAAEPSSFLDGTGLTTNPVYVQDLAFWLPLAAVAAGWLYRRHAWGYPVVGAVLVLWVIEGVGVAVDQWFGHAADPASSVASGVMVWVFAALAAVGLVPLAFYLRSLDRGGRTG
jgi:hypothetical protein